jgi:hypothetical protein
MLCHLSLLRQRRATPSEQLDERVGLSQPIAFELIECLDSDAYDCKAVGGRFVSMKLESDTDSYV